MVLHPGSSTSTEIIRRTAALLPGNITPPRPIQLQARRPCLKKMCGGFRKTILSYRADNCHILLAGGSIFLLNFAIYVTPSGSQRFADTVPDALRARPRR